MIVLRTLPTETKIVRLRTTMNGSVVLLSSQHETAITLFGDVWGF